MILLAIRGETIKYSSRKKKENSSQEKQLEDEILNLESKITETLQTVSQEDINLLCDKKNRLREIRKSRIDPASKKYRTNIGPKWVFIWVLHGQPIRDS